MDYSTCSRCGATLENPYYVNGKIYGSTCYKIALRELGYPTGMRESDFDTDIIKEALELAREANTYKRNQKRRKLISHKAWRVIHGVARGGTMRISKSIESYYFLVLEVENN